MDNFFSLVRARPNVVARFLTIGKQRMPPKVVVKATPSARAKAKAKAKVDTSVRDVYADLPKDLRPTARAMDRIDERRGRKKVVDLLERLVQAMERPRPVQALERPPQQPAQSSNANYAAMNAALARVRELQAQMPSVKLTPTRKR